MKGRILKEKLKDTNGMRQGRSCSIQRMINLKIVSNLQFLVIHFYKYYIMYTQEFLLNLDYVCVCPGMLMYLFICCVHPGISHVVQFFSVKYVPVIIDEEEQWRLVHMSHEGIGTTVEAKAMSGQFGRDKTVSLLSSKVYFPNITHKVKQFVDSCEACQRVKAGSKFENGGDKLKSIHVPLETWTQLGIDLITNLPKTPEGYNTIVTCIDYTSKFIESKPLIGKCAEGVAQFMYELVCHYGAVRIHICNQGREFVN